MTPEQATEAALADITSREGAVKGFLDALGVAAVCTSGAGLAACIVTALAGANHLYADVRQVIHGKEAKTAVVDALVAGGMDPAKAETFEHYVDIGAIVVTLVAGGYKFAVNATALGKDAKALEGLEGEVFGGGAKGGARLTIRDQYIYHDRIRSDVIEQLEAEGYTVSRKEVSFGSSCGPGRCRPDIIYETPDGKMRIVEIKTGNADLSIRQSEIFPQIENGDSIPRGD